MSSEPQALVGPALPRDAVRPRAIRLELTSACQLMCPSCPTASGAARPVLGRGCLKLSDFTALLDANPEIGRVELSNYGEPFLHPDLPGVLRAAYDRRVMLSIDNGANLNNVKDEVLEALVRYRLASMTVSIDGASDETYRKYRVGGDLATVLGNVRKINEHKARYRCTRPELRWQFIVFDHNVHEIGRARAMAAELGMAFALKLGWGELAAVRDPVQVRIVRSQTPGGVASREEFRERCGADYMDGICGQLWEIPQINWDGKVLGCCRNFWGEFGGNAFADGLLPAVNSERMGHAREMLRGRAGPREDVPCTTCEIYLDRRAAGRWVGRGRDGHAAEEGPRIARRNEDGDPGRRRD